MDRSRIGLAGWLTLVAVMLVAASPAAARAHGRGFSFTKSTTEPYAACARPSAHHSECLAILVPSASRKAATPGTPAPALATPSSFPGSGIGGGYAPADLRAAYDLPSASAGSGQTVAIVDAFDDPNAESDLAKYRTEYGIASCTTANGCFRKVNQSGGTSYPVASNEWAVEISLDLDMASAACPNCHILLVEANNNENINLYEAEDEAAALGATQISNSFGGGESSGETSDDQYFNHLGVQITAAAGDKGYEVEYPAASPDVIAVGGTRLLPASNSRGWSETAWSGTGSGCSLYEAKPAWQTDSGCSERTNNDIAADASPESPVSVADSYELPKEFSKPAPGWTLAGGTSVSSPLMAGIMALSNAYTKSLPGAEALYRQAAQNGTGVLDDITSGSNGKCGTYLCNAQTGYDGPSGLGSPHGAPDATTAPHWFKGGTRLKEGSRLAVVSWGVAVNVTQKGPAGELSCRTVSAGYVENPPGTTGRTGEEGPAGAGATEAEAYYECRAPQCEAEIASSSLAALGYRGVGFAVAYNLPWRAELLNASPPYEERIGARPDGNLGAGFAEGFPARSQPPGGLGGSWGAEGAMGMVTGCEIFPNPEGKVPTEPGPALHAGAPARVWDETPFEGELHPLIGGPLNSAASATNPAVIEFTGKASGELEDPSGPGLGGVDTGNVKYLGYETQSSVSVAE
jgi:subtilase family protein